MPVYEILEFIMMICFGFSWPFSCYRSWKSRSTKGKSLIFSILIAIGYACGIAAKILAGNFNLAFYIYWPNITLVITDICLYFRNKKIEEAEAAKKS